MWLNIVIVYYVLNFITTWWFVSNLGVKHTPPWHEYITNMFRTLAQVEVPKSKQDFMFLGLLFAVSWIAIPYMIYACVSCKIDDIRREKLRQQFEEETTRTREKIVADFIAEKKRKAGLDEK